jgi:hypothetical protein
LVEALTLLLLVLNVAADKCVIASNCGGEFVTQREALPAEVALAHTIDMRHMDGALGFDVRVGLLAAAAHPPMRLEAVATVARSHSPAEGFADTDANRDLDGH